MPAGGEFFQNLSHPFAFQNRSGSGSKLTRIRHAFFGVCSKARADLVQCTITYIAADLSRHLRKTCQKRSNQKLTRKWHENDTEAALSQKIFSM